MIDDLRAEATSRLRNAVDKSKRTGRVQFPVPFVIARNYSGATPLARLIRGGQGGDVRLKLYLCITMMATRHPYDLQRSPTPRAWAELLALPPETQKPVHVGSHEILSG